MCKGIIEIWYSAHADYKIVKETETFSILKIMFVIYMYKIITMKKCESHFVGKHKGWMDR